MGNRLFSRGFFLDNNPCIPIPNTRAIAAGHILWVFPLLVALFLAFLFDLSFFFWLMVSRPFHLFPYASRPRLSRSSLVSFFGHHRLPHPLIVLAFDFAFYTVLHTTSARRHSPLLTASCCPFVGCIFSPPLRPFAVVAPSRRPHVALRFSSPLVTFYFALPSHCPRHPHSSS